MRKAIFMLASAGAGVALMRAWARKRHWISFDNKVVLITGGSRGLGLVMARQLCHQGALVTIAARDETELLRAQEDLSTRGGHQVAIEICDLTIEDEAERVVRNVVERHGRIDVLINNAGIIDVGPLSHMGQEDFDAAMATHFLGPLHTMQAALPSMKARRFGRIVNISSIGGKIAVPHLATYSASKFALVGLSDAMRAEVRADGVRVTTVVPGLMRTGSPYNARFRGRARDEFLWFSIADALPLVSMDAERAAYRVLEACRYGDAQCVLGLTAKMAVIAQALAPGLTADALSFVNDRVLPSAVPGGEVVRTGWQSVSNWSPSWVTRLSDRAAEDNNEVPSTT